MLTTVLVLQVFLLLFIIILSIIGWRKLTEISQKLTERLTEDQQQVTEQLTEASQKLTERLTEDQQQVTEQLTEASQKLTQVLSIQLYDRGKLTEASQKLTETLQKLTEKRVSVSYEHITYRKNRLFKSEIVAGYRVQFLYDGLPIGEPTEKIVYYADKVDEEAVREALAAALQTLQVTIEKSGISLTVLNKVTDVIKTLFKK